MELHDLSIPLGSFYEKNISITELNSSMTLIGEIKPNSGALWGLYIELQSTYLPTRNRISDLKLFSTNDLSTCCQKILDHVSYYTVSHVTKPVNESYVTALYNTHEHDEETAVLDLTILKGHIGEEVNILSPPTTTDPLISFLTIASVATVAILVIGIVAYTFIIKPKKRN